MTLPNFMIIGVAKAGSTSLYNYLKQHPEIFMSPVKEPRYFSPEYYTTYYKKAGRGNIYHEGMSLRTYQSLFEDVHKEIAIGEASTEYMFFEKTPKRISVTIPHAKIISILRNPVDRAFSAYCYHLRDGRESLSFKEALNQEEERIREHWQVGWFYKAGGFYYEQLKRYYEQFDSKNIKVVLWKDLNEAPQRVCAEIFDFLSVDVRFRPNLTRANKSHLPRNAPLNRLVFKNSSLKKPLKQLLPSSLYEGVAKLTKNFFYTEKKQMDTNIRMELVSVYYNDICKLEDLLCIDLSAWKKI